MYSQKSNCVCERSIDILLIYYQDRSGSTYCIFLQQNRHTDGGIIKIAPRHMHVEMGSEVAQFLSGNICSEFSVLYLCNAAEQNVINCHRGIHIFIIAFLNILLLVDGVSYDKFCTEKMVEILNLDQLLKTLDTHILYSCKI